MKSYPLMKRQIHLLRFELANPVLIGENEIIDALSLGSNESGEICSASGRIANKTMTIAMQYQDLLQRMNKETLSDIMQELHDIESEVARIEYHVSLLDDQKAMVIRSLYFERLTWVDTEAKMSISKRSLMNYRNEAINEVAGMYSYLASIKGDNT